MVRLMGPRHAVPPLQPWPGQWPVGQAGHLDTLYLSAVSTPAWSETRGSIDPVTGQYQEIDAGRHEALDEAKGLTHAYSATFSNTSSMTQLASLGLLVNVLGQASTAPVPEAGTAFMVSMGLGLMALALRRRRAA